MGPVGLDVTTSTLQRIGPLGVVHDAMMHPWELERRSDGPLLVDTRSIGGGALGREVRRVMFGALGPFDVTIGLPPRPEPNAPGALPDDVDLAAAGTRLADYIVAASAPLDPASFTNFGSRLFGLVIRLGATPPAGATGNGLWVGLPGPAAPIAVHWHHVPAIAWFSDRDEDHSPTTQPPPGLASRAWHPPGAGVPHPPDENLDRHYDVVVISEPSSAEAVTSPTWVSRAHSMTRRGGLVVFGFDFTSTKMPYEDLASGLLEASHGRFALAALEVLESGRATGVSALLALRRLS